MSANVLLHEGKSGIHYWSSSFIEVREEPGALACKRCRPDGLIHPDGQSDWDQQRPQLPRRKQVNRKSPRPIGLKIDYKIGGKVVSKERILLRALKLPF